MPCCVISPLLATPMSRRSKSTSAGASEEKIKCDRTRSFANGRKIHQAGPLALYLLTEGSFLAAGMYSRISFFGHNRG